MAVSIVFFSQSFAASADWQNIFQSLREIVLQSGSQAEFTPGGPWEQCHGVERAKSVTAYAWSSSSANRRSCLAFVCATSNGLLAYICWQLLTNGNLWKISLSRLCKTSLLCQVQSEEYNVFCGQEDVFRWSIPDQSYCYLSPDATDTCRFGTQSGLLVGGNVMEVSRSEIMGFVMICARTIKDYHRISEADSSIGKLR